MRERVSDWYERRFNRRVRLHMSFGIGHERHIETFYSRKALRAWFDRHPVLDAESSVAFREEWVDSYPAQVRRMVGMSWRWIVAHRDPRYKVTAYQVYRAYAGPEEGGRYYDDYQQDDTRRCWTRRGAERVGLVLEELYPRTHRSSNYWGGEDHVVFHAPRFGKVESYINNHPGPYC